MGRRVIGTVLATVALYMWGFLYWGISPLPYGAWKQTRDDAAAAQVIREHFPERGTYYLPGRGHDEATLTRLHEAGPVAFVHVTAPDGRPMLDTGIMLRGFLLNGVVMGLLTVLLAMVAPALPSYAKRVAFVVLAGLAAAVFVDLGDAVWWQIPLEWKIHQALYTLTASVVAGLVLAAFVKDETA